MFGDILILCAVALVTGLGALFSAISFMHLPEASGILVLDQH
jgi:hypothetical protein